MKHGRWMRATGIAALGLAVTITLSGCATLVGNVIVQNAASSAHQKKVAATAAKNKGKPTKGECWVATIKYADYATWGNRKPVKCSEPHQLVTFSVLPLSFTHTGKLFDKNGYVPDAIYNDGYEACDAAESRVSEDINYDSRIYLEFYFPEQSEWNRGARWVRCDFGVIALGSSVAHPKFENLPAWSELDQSIKKTPKVFDFCTNDPGGDQPKGPNAVYADCTQNPQWALQDIVPVPQSSDDNYPTPAQMKADYGTSCANIYSNAGKATFPYYPTKSEWDNGQTGIECWIGKK